MTEIVLFLSYHQLLPLPGTCVASQRKGLVSLQSQMHVRCFFTHICFMLSLICHFCIEILLKGTNSFAPICSGRAGNSCWPLWTSGWLLHWIFPLCCKSEDISTPFTWHGLAEQIRHQALSCTHASLTPGLSLSPPAHSYPNKDQIFSHIHLAPIFILKSWARNPHPSQCHVV